MAGENADSEADAPHKPDEFLAKTKWQRFQVYVAGPVMNIVDRGRDHDRRLLPRRPASRPTRRTRPVVGHVAPDSPGRARRHPPAATSSSRSPGGGRRLGTVRARGDAQGRTARSSSSCGATASSADVRLTPASRTQFEIGDIGVAPAVPSAGSRRLNPASRRRPPGLLVGDVILAVNGTQVDDELAAQDDPRQRSQAAHPHPRAATAAARRHRHAGARRQRRAHRHRAQRSRGAAGRRRLHHRRCVSACRRTSSGRRSSSAPSAGCSRARRRRNS